MLSVVIEVELTTVTKYSVLVEM